MGSTAGEEHLDLLGPADDEFHVPSDDPWETETCWFSWLVPERNLMGYLYSFIRPNKGVSGGGVLVWDHTAHEPWNLPYFDYPWHLPLPLDDAGELADLRNIRFPNGMGVRMLEPLMRYHLTYSSKELELDLHFQGTTPPHAFTRGEPPFVIASHLDQPGHVTGTMVLHGETVPVDCYEMRDRSWGPRTDLKGIRVGYCFATASPTDAFLAFSVPQRGAAAEGVDEPLTAGYLLRDGVRAAMSKGIRRVRRDPVHGWVTHVVIEGEDDLGRPMRAVGEPVNRVAFYPYPRMFNWTSMCRWHWDGVEGWGEDQDVWRPDQWRSYRSSRTA
jgi:hypothetical protein